MKGLYTPQAFYDFLNSRFLFDDFAQLDSGIWTTTATDSGTATVSAGDPDEVILAPSDGTVADNDEIYILTPELFLFAADKPLSVIAGITYTEANTDDANIFVGLMDGVAANSIQDDGAGPKASFAGVGFYKVDGSTNWSVIHSDGATQETVELTAANSVTKTAKTAGGGTRQDLQIDVVMKAGSKMDVMFIIDGQVVYKMTDKTYANATEMSLAVGAKNGDTNNESIKVDYAGVAKTR